MIWLMVLLAAGATLAGLALGWVMRGRRLADTVARVRRSAELSAASLRSRLDAAEERTAVTRARLEEVEAARQAAAVEHNINESLLVDAQESRATALRELALARAEAAKAAARVVEMSAELDTYRERLARAGAAVVRSRGTAVDLCREGDDLQQVNGIGPAFARALHSMGITTFYDLAAISDEEAERLEQSLGTFAGRIAQEKWRDQARELIPGVEV